MKEPYVFVDDIKISDVMDEQVIDSLVNKSILKGDIIDVRNDNLYRSKDIDFILSINNKTIEVKSDFYESGNLFMKIYSCFETKTEGCFIKTECDFMIYYFVHSNMAYILNREILDYLKINWERLKKENNWAFKEVENKSKGGRLIHALGLTIPREWLKTKFPQIKIVRNIVDMDWFVQNWVHLTPKLDMKMLKAYSKHWLILEH